MPRRLALAILPALALTATAAGAEQRLPVIAGAAGASLVDASFTTTGGAGTFGSGSLSLDGRAFTEALGDSQAAVVERLARDNDAQLGASAQPVQGRATGGTHRTAAVTASKVARLPEPATWAMMIMGFGLIGGAVRRGLRKSDERFNAYIRSITEDADA